MPEPIAIVGLAALFPGSSDAHGFWRDIVSGRDLITEVPERRWLIGDHYDPDPQAAGKTYCRRGAFLSPVDFDPFEFGLPPNALPATDTCQLLALVVAKRVLDDVLRSQSCELDRERASVILGVTSGQELFLEVTSPLRRPFWVKALRESGIAEDQVRAICDRIAASSVPWQESTFPGMLGNVVAGRIANRFDFHGTNCVTDAACASSLAAVSMAVDELRLGRSNFVLAGGADTFNDISMFVAFSKTPALSPTGDCRPFSDRADGTLLGEGFGIFALKRLSDAESDGNQIYSVIRGMGSSSDGKAKSIYAPLPSGQVRAMERAYEDAGFSPGDVGLVEAHGTGTAAGDQSELESLTAVFGKAPEAEGPRCALGSVKSQVGHTKAAAGAAGLFKIALAVHQRVLPPTIKVERPNAQLQLADSPFYLNTRARPWITAGKTRRAAVSAFGFGGTNFHLVLEEYAGPGKKPLQFWSANPELVLLSGDTVATLKISCGELADQCDDQRTELASIGLASQVTFRPDAPCRLAIIGMSAEEISLKLRHWAINGAAGPGLHYGEGLPGARKIAFLFPGQGSQYPWMGADVAIAFPQAFRVWEEATGVAELVFPRAAFSREEQDVQSRHLSRTEWAQTALGASSAALLSLLHEAGLQPDAVAGHSFGELTALYAAGGLDLSTLLSAARHRGELMAESSSEPAGMLSVNTGAEQLERHLHGSSLNVVVANHNSPKQAVLSGAVGPLAEAKRKLTEAGLACMALPVSSAFHSELMKPAATRFAEYMKATPFNRLRVPVYSNLDGSRSQGDSAAIGRRLAEQIAEPVRFQKMIERMYADGIRTFVEVGPRDVLTALVRSILVDQPCQAIALDRQGVDGVQSLWDALGQLSIAGVPIDYQRLRSAHRIAPLETAARPKFSIAVDGGNIGRPYPPPGGTAALPGPNSVKAPPPAVTAPQPEAFTAIASPPHSPPSTAETAPPDPRRQEQTGAKLPDSSPPSSQSNEATLVEAFKVFQDSLSQAQQDWQACLSRGHESFLQAMENAYAGVLGEQPARLPPSGANLPASVPAMAPPAVIVQPRPPELFAVARPATPMMPEPAAVVAPAGPAAPSHNVEQLLTAIVAEKTGFPVEMLQPSMALETDLGIDSIKRVEIFCEVQERLPGLPEIDPGQMGSLRTLAEIATLLHESLPASATTASPATTSESAISLAPLLKRIVSEKTGYPVEMLNEEMALEADLGIDSIKRVEIFCELQEQLPHLPEIDPGEMGSLRTLTDIVAALETLLPADSAVTMPAAVVAAVPSTVGLASVLTAIISEKTGYPAEMLSPSMMFDADLGIDSIKRVEIFCELQEQMRHLPEMDPARIGSFRTINEVVAALEALPAVPAPAFPSGVVETAAKNTDAIRLPDRCVVSSRPAAATGHATIRHGDGAILISPDGGGIDAEVTALLKREGFEIAGDKEIASVFLCLAGLRSASSIEEALGVHREAFQFAKLAARRLSTTPGVFVTVQDTGGDFSSPVDLRAWSGGLAALARTAALEWPLARVKAIDIEIDRRPAHEIAAALVQELLGGGPEIDTGLKADGERMTVQVQEAPLPAVGGTSLPANSVILASGGARGVTAASLIKLAEESSGLRVGLLGRTPIAEEAEDLRGCRDESALRQALIRLQGSSGSPARIQAELARVLAAREVRRTITALQAAGCQVRYLAVDGRNSAQVAAVASEIRSAWGPITCVVHAAGVLADKRIVDLTADQFDAVFSTKAAGLRVLLEATANDPLAYLVLFSSVAARYGNPGQAAYAMANEVMNKVALAESRRRGAGCTVKSINWGPWDGGMVTPALARHFEQTGVSLIQLTGGAQAFVNELKGGTSDQTVEIIIGAPLQEGSRELHVRISRASHPYLEDHQIRNEPVLPLVEALKLVLQLAQESGRTLTPQSHIDIRVLRGVHLTGFFNGGDSLRVRFQAGRFELLSGEGIRHYEVTIQDQSPIPPDLSGGLGQNLSAAPWSESGLYPDLLFHGPEFRLIQQIDGISEQGIAGTLHGRSGQPWRTGTAGFDPGMLDGGLQLALLWARHYLGQPTLPMRVGALRLLQAPADYEPVNCRVLAKSRRSGIICDFEFRSTTGDLLATMKDVELYAVANL